MRTRELLGVAAVTVVLVLLATAAAVFSRGGFSADRWTIRWIEATGPFHRVSAEQIRSTAAPLATGGFVAVDLERIRAAVEALPWVRAAGVKKKWPATLRIRVLEHEPLAHWNGEHLVSALGEVFSVSGAASIQGLPRLGGADEEAPRVVRFHRDLSARLEGTGLDVTAVSLSRRGAWSVELTGGIRLEIGRQEVDARLDRLMTVIGGLTGTPGRTPERVDLRYTNGLAVRWREQSAPELIAAAPPEGR